MKKEIFAWVAKDENIDYALNFDDYGDEKDPDAQLYFGIEAYRTKGNRSGWNERDWPPKRIKITIEEV